MTRALAADLMPIVDARGPSVANPGLRLTRWVDWGESFRLADADQTSFLKGAVNLFKKQAKPDSPLSAVLAALQLRVQERAQMLQSRGLTVREVHAVCAGRLRDVPRVPSASDPGMTIDRNTGLPYVPSVGVRELLRAGRDQAGDTQAGLDAVTVFDAFPCAVPRIESDLLVFNQAGIREISAERQDEARRQRPVEQLSVVPGTEVAFWLAGTDASVLDAAERWLRAALERFNAQPRVSTQEEKPEVEIIAGPAMTPVADGSSGLVARATTVHYQVNNGRIVAMFRHSSGKDVKAEEHASNVAMSDEMRKRLGKKKVLQDLDIEVEAVGNAWRIRGICG